MQSITAAKLYDYTQCPHRVWRDIYGPQDEKIKEPNPFVDLLWSRGVAHEEKIVSQIGEHLDLRSGSYLDRFERTTAAMKNNIPLIYQGVLIHNHMFGIPDLLRHRPDGRYTYIEHSVLRRELAMDTKILIPVDGSHTATRTLEKIVALKERFPRNLTLLHVVDIDKPAYRMIPDFQVEMIRENAGKAGEQVLAAKQAMLEDAGFEVEARLEFGPPRQAICKVAVGSPDGRATTCVSTVVAASPGV